MSGWKLAYRLSFVIIVGLILSGVIAFNVAAKEKFVSEYEGYAEQGEAELSSTLSEVSTFFKEDKANSPIK